MRVAEQQVEAGDGTFEQRLAEVADARTGIDDDGAIVGLDLDLDLDAGCIAAVADDIGRRHWEGATDAQNRIFIGADRLVEPPWSPGLRCGSGRRPAGR